MRLVRTTGRDPDFIALTRQLDAALRAEYGDAQDTYEQYNLVDTDTAIVAYGGDEPVGCGCFKPYDGDSVELKRMYVDDARRGSGLGRTLLLALETWARELGYRAMVLETGTRQHAAVALYERAGYTRIPLYPPYVGMALSICMRKLLT